MTYHPSRGGHASGAVRGLFVDLVELYTRATLTPHQYTKLIELTGTLWNCTDRVPAYMKSDLDELKGNRAGRVPTTYAQAARLLRYLMR